MKKPEPHWEDLPSDEMYELISDVAKLFCWYIFWAKSLPAEESILMTWVGIGLVTMPYTSQIGFMRILYLSQWSRQFL